MCGTCCVHVQWVDMLRVEKCTYAFDAKITFASCRLTQLTSGVCFHDDSHHWWNRVGEPIPFFCQHVVGHEDSA